MFCPNCGKENPSGSPVCPSCGYRMGPVTAPPADQGTQRKKGKKGFVIALVCVALVLLAGGVFAALNFSLCANLFHRSFSSPEKYYQYVETRNAAAFGRGLSGVLGGLKKADYDPKNLRFGSTVEFRLEDGARDLLNDAMESTDDDSDINLSWLKSLTLETELSRLNELLNTSLAVKLNNKEIAAADGTMELGKELVWLRVRQISDAYMELDASGVLAELERETGLSFREWVDRISGVSPAELDAEQVQKVMERYLAMVTEELDSVQKDRDRLTVQNVAGTYTTLTVTVRERDVQALAEKLASALRKDRDVREILESVGTAMGRADLYDSFLDEMQELEKGAENIQLEDNIVMKLWVDLRGNIRARSLKSGDTELFYAALMKNGRCGLELRASAPSEDICLRGNGKVNGKTLTGEFTLEYNGKEYAYLELGKADLTALLQGKLSAEMELTLLRDFYLAMGMEAGRARSLEKLSMEFGVEADRTQYEAHAVLVGSGDDAYATLDFTGELEQAESVRPVSGAIPPDAWIGGITEDVIVAYMDDLRAAGIPDEIVDSVQETAVIMLFYYSLYSLQ